MSSSAPKTSAPEQSAAERLEELVRESRLLEPVHDAVVLTDLDGVITGWSRGSERTYGYTATEVIGRPVTVLRFPEDLPHHRETVIAPALEHGINEIVARNRRKDGSEIFVDLRLGLLRDADGTPTHLLGCANDVTARIRAESALRRQQQDLQMILDSVPALIWYKDRDNRILRCNRAAAASMGVTVEELEGRSTYDIYPDEAAKYHQDDLEVIRSGRAKLGIVEMILTGSGDKRWVRTDKVPYLNDRGEIVGVIVFAVDITERVTAETELQRAHDELELRVAERTTELRQALERVHAEISERQLAEARALQHQAQLAHVLRLGTVEGIAAQLAHEINQPLAAVVNFANGILTRLRAKRIDVAGMEQASEQIRQQALRAAGVIQRLRDFVRKQPPKRQRCSLNQVVRNATGLIEAEAKQLGVPIIIALTSENPTVMIDRVQIEQVVLNLLRNGLDAVKAVNRPRHSLTIITSMFEKDAEVRIGDTGPGLPPQAKTRLFEPFFTTKQHGLGMGLAISRSILEAHGGSIKPESTKRGTTISFVLPLARRRAVPTAKKPIRPKVKRAGTKARRR